MLSSKWSLIQKWHTSIHVFAVLSLLASITPISGCASVPTIDKSLQDRALAGDAEAQYQIGLIYVKARYAAFGKSAYWDDAAEWFEMAANQGDERAPYWLSEYHLSKRSDYHRSFRWLQLPAQRGIAEAQGSLAVHYAQAWGTPQDLVLAYKWLALAIEGEMWDPIGKAADLEWLIRRGNMSPEEVREGQRLAEEHTARYGRSRSIHADGYLLR